MSPTCTSCGYVYERENGYFMGSALVGYFIGAFSIVPTLAIGMVGLQWTPMRAVGIASAQLILLLPLLLRVSRLLWIHFDFDADPEQPV